MKALLRSALSVLVGSALALLVHGREEGELDAVGVVTRLHELNKKVLLLQASIRSAGDFEKFKATRAECENEMLKLGELFAKQKAPSDFTRREMYGVQSRFMYELFPPNLDPEHYVKGVPEQFRAELKKLGATPNPAIEKLWRDISRISIVESMEGDFSDLGILDLERNSYSNSTVGVGGNLNAFVSSGWRNDRASGEKGARRPGEGPKILKVRVISKTEGQSDVRLGQVVYEQEFPFPDEWKKETPPLRKIVRHIKITRELIIELPGAVHKYQLPPERPLPDLR